MDGKKDGLSAQTINRLMLGPDEIIFLSFTMNTSDQVAFILLVLWSRDWRHYRFESKPITVSSHVLGEKGQEIVHHSYRKNVSERVVVAVKLGRTTFGKNPDTLGFSSGCPRCHVAVLQLCHSPRCAHCFGRSIFGPDHGNLSAMTKPSENLSEFLQAEPRTSE